MRLRIISNSCKLMLIITLFRLQKCRVSLFVFAVFYLQLFCGNIEYLKLRENEEYAVLRMYGITEGGHSVMAHIHNFLSYFYVELSQEF